MTFLPFNANALMRLCVRIYVYDVEISYLPFCVTMRKFVFNVDTAVSLLRCHQKPRRDAIFVMFYSSPFGGMSRTVDLVSDFKAYPVLSTLQIPVFVYRQ
jgi:hypothetical protein